jgi:hypothetical protein
MDDQGKALMEKVLAGVRENDTAVQELSAALLSQDKPRIKQVFHDVAGVDFTDAEVDSLVAEFGTEDKIAAFT